VACAEQVIFNQNTTPLSMSADAKKRVLIVANELSPYVEDTVFAPILNALSRKTFDSGLEIRVIMPRFGTINERRHRLHEVVRLSGINIIIDKDDYPLIIKVASLPNARLQVYFMDNEDYYKRKFTTRDEAGTFYDDNAERMVFFCKSALETVKKFGWPPHLIHCHGWMTSLLPVYLKTAYKREPVFAHSKVAYTVQNPQFTETLSPDFVKKALVNQDLKEKDLELFKPGTAEALTLGAIKCADVLIQGEPELIPSLDEAMKPARNKKVVRWDDSWAEDVSPLLSLYKSLVEVPVKA
jgi:starch synthase